MEVVRIMGNKRKRGFYDYFLGLVDVSFSVRFFVKFGRV